MSTVFCDLVTLAGITRPHLTWIICLSVYFFFLLIKKIVFYHLLLHNELTQNLVAQNMSFIMSQNLVAERFR